MRNFRFLILGALLSTFFAMTPVKALEFVKGSDLATEGTPVGADTVTLTDVSSGTTDKATLTSINASAANIGASTIVTTGALDSGSITANFGTIDTGVSDITTGGIVVIDVDGTAINAAGSVTFGDSNDDSIYHNGTNLEIDTSTAIELSISGTPEADLAADGFNIITGDSYQINNTSVLDATTLGGSVVTSSLTTVGTLASGSIASGFGAIDINTNNITTGGIIKIDVDGTAENAAGSLTLGIGNDAGLFFDNTNLVIITNGAGASGIILDTEDDTVEIKGSGTLQATFDTEGLDLVTGDAYEINNTSVLSSTVLGSAVVTSSLTSVGALNSGSIATGFGVIDTGVSNVTTGGIIRIDVDGSAINSAGSFGFGAVATDSGIYWDGTNLVIDTTAAIDFSISGSTEGDIAGDGMNIITGDSYQINNTSVLDATTLGSAVVTSSLTTVGVLASGSVASGFGNIDNGTSNITSGGTWLIDIDGSAINAAGALTYGTGNDAASYFDGADLVAGTSTTGLKFGYVESSAVDYFETGTNTFRIDFSDNGSDTAMLLYSRADNSLIRVTTGVNDSGGAGRRALTIPNL